MDDKDRRIRELEEANEALEGLLPMVGKLSLAYLALRVKALEEKADQNGARLGGCETELGCLQDQWGKHDNALKRASHAVQELRARVEK